MKRRLLFIFTFIVSIFFASCSSEEIVYSCDDAVDAWVKKNLMSIQKMSRKDWLNLSSDKSIAAYRAFTANQRINFWRDKLNEVKNLQWSVLELEHIEKVEHFIESHLDLFSGAKLTEEQKNEIDLFFYKWQDYAIEELGWNRKLCYLIAASGSVLDTKKENANDARTLHYDTIDPSLKEKNCHCNVKYDFCDVTFQGECEESFCYQSDVGCGWIFLNDCNGRCSLVL